MLTYTQVCAGALFRAHVLAIVHDAGDAHALAYVCIRYAHTFFPHFFFRAYVLALVEDAGARSSMRVTTHFASKASLLLTHTLTYADVC